MKDIEIKISRETSCVDLPKRQAFAVDGENLQGNFIFSFVDEFVNGQARLELTIDGQDSWIPLLKSEETYYCPIKSAITKKGQIDMQLVVTENESEDGIPIFKSNTFYLWCEASINAEIEQPDEYPTWIEIANEKLNEMDNLDIEATKSGNTTTVIVTKKDGKEESVEILDGQDGQDGQAGEDGVGLDYNWSGTSLGVKRENETEYQYTNLKGDKGDAGAIKMQVVQTLPTTGDEDTIYLVPKTGSTGDIYDEYIYTNGSWEKIGSTDIDLSNYATKDEVNAKYTKPASGIPSTDIADGVLTPIVDLSSYQAGDYITNSDTVAKLKDERVVVKYNGICYRFATLYGTGYVYTVMHSTTGGAYVSLNYESGNDRFQFYETGTASWEALSNKVQNLNTPTTETYPSTLAVYNALQGLGGGENYVLNINDATVYNFELSVIQNIIDAMHKNNLNSIYLISQPKMNNVSDFWIASLSPALISSTTSYTLDVWRLNFVDGTQYIPFTKYKYMLTISWNDNVPIVTNKSAGTQYNNNIILNSNTLSWTPSTDYSPTSKKYVDDLLTNKENTTNKVTLLTSSSTDTQYPSAKCVYDALQGAGGGSSMYLGHIGDFSANNPIDLTNMNKGIYFIRVDHKNSWGNNDKLYFKATVNNSNITGNVSLSFQSNAYIYYDYVALVINTKISDMTVTSTSTAFARLFYLYYTSATGSNNTIKFNSDNLRISTSQIDKQLSSISYDIDITDVNQSISGKKTFTTLPESSVTPTTNNQLVNKKYVDDSISSAITTTLNGSY